MRKDVPTGRSCCVSALRRELIARNSAYASLNLLPNVSSYGELPVVVYQPSECGRHHGNFIAASNAPINCMAVPTVVFLSLGGIGDLSAFQ